MAYRPTSLRSPVVVGDAATVRVGLDLPAEARVDVLSSLGTPVAVLHDGPLDAGEHTIPLDLTHLRPGAYVVRIETPEGRDALTVTVGQASVDLPVERW